MFLLGLISRIPFRFRKFHLKGDSNSRLCRERLPLGHGYAITATGKVNRNKYILAKTDNSAALYPLICKTLVSKFCVGATVV